jgi:hypothetical protein
MAATYQQRQQQNQNAIPVPFIGGTNLIHGDPSAQAYPQIADFGATGVPASGYVIDPSRFFNNGSIKSIQTIYFDNSNNNAFATVYNPQFNQQFSLPAGYQGFFNILCGKGSGGVLYVTTTGGTGLVTVSLLNVYLPTATWAALSSPLPAGSTIPVSDAVLDPLAVGGRFNVRTLSAQFTGVDRSGTIAAANTSQVLMPANAARQGFTIENIDGAILEALWISFVGAAAVGGAGSFSLAAASSPNFPGGSIQGVVSNQITVVSTTIAHKFSALEW